MADSTVIVPSLAIRPERSDPPDLSKSPKGQRESPGLGGPPSPTPPRRRRSDNYATSPSRTHRGRLDSPVEENRPLPARSPNSSRADSRSPPPERGRRLDRNRSRSVSYSRSRSGSYSRSPQYSRSRPKSYSRSISRSPSPPSKRRRRATYIDESPSPPPIERKCRPLPDVDYQRALERERQAAEREEKEVKPFDPKAEYQRLLDLRSGGTYVPPARLRALQSQIIEGNPKEHQRLAWDNLKKGINGLINKVNKANIREIVQDIFRQNLIRGRGLFVRSVMRAQAASLPFTPVYAAVAAIVNTKLPQLGELLVTRLIIQFRKAYRRNDKPVCISSTMFLAHLCNYQIAHEIVILQILHLLLERPTDDSVEIAVGFMREVGMFLAKASAPANNGVFERFRAILHEGQLEPRTQYMIESLFLVRKNEYRDNPDIADELDLVEEDDQITHMIGLDDELNGEDILNVFKFDPDYEGSEAKYKEIRDEILGAEDSEENSDESEVSSEDEDEEHPSEQKKMEIQDMTNRNLVNLRRTIYLTIRSSMDYEECCHKLMRINLAQGQEVELVNMIIECCSQEKIYSKFYGLIGERFCKINRLWKATFSEAFKTYYDTIHRYETNKIRNIAKFFAHILASDGLGWEVLDCIHLNEDETTASSRIFLKILFQDMAEELGMKTMVGRFNDPDRDKQAAFRGILPRDNPSDTRFAINFFTVIGLGAVTEDLRDYLQRAMEKAKEKL
ncbi:armadillo-type protein [Lipomyces tetrasporus]|uniref:Pre-mRNA-splicing factor CWC22 n=1 Tax=Lipomyces tetrasporus TaxID=54092 RepID=A0AAD7QZH4_9ASCO|nr:armadillo-type protein [Lipomyces tetrasporus]KAJ8103968.1 armadillo-type protein [Lipomyces tetrasporus]